MQQPHYIRFISPPNANSILNTLPQGKIRFISIQPSISVRTSTPSRQIVNKIEHSSSVTDLPCGKPSSTHQITDSSTDAIQNEAPSTQVAVPAVETISTTSSPSISICTNESKTIDPILKADSNSNASTLDLAPKSSDLVNKRSRSPSFETKHLNVKKLNTKVKKEEINIKTIRRSKNWSESETVAFIGVWEEHYSKLTTGNRRHSPIYNAMAEQINKILAPRCERPYNDNSLLSDSMMTDQEDLLEEIINVEVPDLNSTQLTKETDESFSFSNDIERTISPIRRDSPTLESRKSNQAIAECSTKTLLSLSTKKNQSSKKKSADMKSDLMKQLLVKIEDANAAAAESEVKMLKLLEKQTQLQAESVQNDKDFLNVFKMLVHNISTGQ
ncbi:unnamed protein product [Adineta ricciae]|uniref:Uncharacterized protein n=1 Tax=Adineta ricciae TaxID=249248 RepID=A0A814DU47_ADIRI|nr:unnamed protein product [Adineta ricciae]